MLQKQAKQHCQAHSQPSIVWLCFANPPFHSLAILFSWRIVITIKQHHTSRCSRISAASTVRCDMYRSSIDWLRFEGGAGAVSLMYIAQSLCILINCRKKSVPGPTPTNPTKASSPCKQLVVKSIVHQSPKAMPHVPFEVTAVLQYSECVLATR